MNSLSDAIGSVTHGALLSRALEPSHGEGAQGSAVSDGHTHESACLNCGTALVGPHCHQCGQRGHVHRTIGAFFHDLLHGVFHFEGKLWRTLPLLAWHPGRLTREYIAGRRASYVSPIALFLFVVFLTFASISMLGGSMVKFNTKVDGTTVTASADESVVRMEERIAEARQERAEALAAGRPVNGIDQEIAGLQRGVETIRAVDEGDLGAVMDDVAVETNGAGTGFLDRLGEVWLKAKENPDLLIYKLQSNAYKYSWLLIPLSVPFMWLLFPFSGRFHLYDHTVFVTYSLSFMMLILIIASAGAMYDLAPLVMIPVLYAPLHMYRQLRGAYSLGRLSALARTGVLIVFAFCVIGLWAAALLGLILGL